MEEARAEGEALPLEVRGTHFHMVISMTGAIRHGIMGCLAALVVARALQCLVGRATTVVGGPALQVQQAWGLTATPLRIEVATAATWPRWNA